MFQIELETNKRESDFSRMNYRHKKHIFSLYVYELASHFKYEGSMSFVLGTLAE